MCALGGLPPEVVQKGNERRFRSLCQWQDTDLTRPKCCILDRFWMFSTSRRENIVDAADLSKSTCCRLGQHQCGKASSQGEYSESSTHVHAVLPTVGLAESAFGYDCEQLLLALDHCEELFPKFRNQQASWCRWRTRLKTGQFFDIGFLVSKRVNDWARPHSAGNGADDYEWRKKHGFSYNNTGIRNSRKQVFLASEKR